MTDNLLEQSDQVIKDLGRAMADFIKDGLDGLGSITVSIGANGRIYNATVGVMSACPHCGEDVYSDAQFCPYCGTEFDDVDSEEEAKE